MVGRTTESGDAVTGATSCAIPGHAAAAFPIANPVDNTKASNTRTASGAMRHSDLVAMISPCASVQTDDDDFASVGAVTCFTSRQI
jgi:hypothetical protein